MRRWESVGGGSSKFWEAVAEGATVTVRYGRLGAQGRTQVKELESADAARAYLTKATAEKERKGYREVGPAATPAQAPVSAGPAGHVTAGPAATDTGTSPLPDEDTFVMPAHWARQAYPRRGGIRRTVSAPPPGARALVRKQLAERTDWVERMLSAPKSDPAIVEATRAHLAGSHNPLGAAVVALLTMEYQLADSVFVDVWAGAHGMPFAARAVVESFSVQPHYVSYGGRRDDPWIGLSEEGTGTAAGATAG